MALLAPPIDDPELLARLAMDDAEFGEYLRGFAAALPAREYEPAHLERALGYPWARPRGSFRLTPGSVEPLAEMGPAERDAAIAEHTDPEQERTPLLAIGSNGAPEVLERKFAHFAEERDRSLLVLAGDLHGFDVGFAANPALYGSLPATLFPSPGTTVSLALLWVTPAQLTQLAWTEVSYRLGTLSARFEVAEGGAVFEQALAFVSRFGTLRVGEGAVAMGAVPAGGRDAETLSQEQALDLAARLALGPEATAAILVRAVFEDYPATVRLLAETVNRQSLRFETEAWEPFVTKS